MKNKIILHLPHSSLELPDLFYNKDLMATQDEVDKLNFEITDLYTDDLFNIDKYDSVKAKYSRIFCDVERFPNDKKEEMSKFGRGMIYTKDLRGKVIRKPNKNYRNEILNNYYKQYHAEFSEKVNYELMKNEKVIIVDCHSFAKSGIESIKDVGYLPDICIGVNEVNKRNFKLITIVLVYFDELGYDVMLDYPYQGSIMPNKIKKNKKNLYSIMIEINKDIYLKGKDKNEKFDKLKEDIKLLLKILENIDLNKGVRNGKVLPQ